MRNVLFNGRIASLPPVAESRKGNLRLIRPLAYVTETSRRSTREFRDFCPLPASAERRKVSAGRSVNFWTA